MNSLTFSYEVLLLLHITPFDENAQANYCANLETNGKYMISLLAQKVLVFAIYRTFC